jgi:tetratricopeptide (TPR) repeat protein
MENIASTTASGANQAYLEGHPETAVAGYREALKLDPGNAKTYYNLALAQQKLADTGAAIASLEKAVSLDTDFADARNQLGLFYPPRRAIQRPRSNSTPPSPPIRSAQSARTTSALWRASEVTRNVPKLYFAKPSRTARRTRRPV